MALNNLGLGFIFTAKDLASGVMGTVKSSLTETQKAGSATAKALTNTFSQFGTGLAVFGAGAGILAGAFTLASASFEFTDALSSLRAVSGATAEQMERLKNAAIDAGIATQFDPTQAATALGDLAQAGFNTDDSLKLLTPTLDLAAGSLGKLTPSGAAGLASQAMKAFKIDVDDAGVAVDQMLQAVNVFALSAEELPLALGTAARGAGSLNQSLSETLIALGLVKNVVPGVERASTSVAVAMEKMVDPKVQAALKRQGAAVVDTAGHFRPFLDIIGDLLPKLGKMTDAKRAAYLQDTFGTEALGGINAIMAQVTNGIQTNTGETVRGADALKYLRTQFDEAGGTAAKFAAEMLKDIPGQLHLLQGSLKTFAIVAGEPFAEAFKPIVEVVLGAVNKILLFIRALPMGTKVAIAKFVLIAGSLISFVGAIIAGKAAIAMFIVGMKAAGITLASVITILAPAILAVGAMTLAFYGFKVAYEQNIGGFADFVDKIWKRATLAFEGLSQLFTQGGFSGAVREEFQKAENGGVENFVVNLYLWANRIASFFQGVGKGFSEAMVLAKPAIDGFMFALNQLGVSLGFLTEKDSAFENALAWERMGELGQRVGAWLVKAFTTVVNIMTAVIDITRGAVKMYDDHAPAFAMFGNSLGAVADKFGELGVALGVGDAHASSSSNAWTTFGAALSAIAGILTVLASGFISVFAAIVAVVTGAVDILRSLFSGLGDSMAGLGIFLHAFVDNDWNELWFGMKLFTFGILDAIIGSLIEFVGAAGGIIDSFAKMFGKDLGIQSALRGLRAQVHDKAATGWGIDSMTGLRGQAAPLEGTGVVGVAHGVPEAPFIGPPRPPDMMFSPAVAQTEAAGAAASSASPDYSAMVSTMEKVEANTKAGQTINATFMVDSEVIGRASTKAKANDGARSFEPFPNL